MKEIRKWNDTDYNIPKFSYKSAFLIFGVTFFLTILTTWMTDGNRQCIILVLSSSMALTTTCSRYFIDTKRGFTKQAALTAAALFLISFIILQFVPF